MISIIAAAGTDAASKGFLETFGVNTPFFIAQLVNFIIVLIVLKKFAFTPIQNMLEQRKNRIAEGEDKLKRIEQQLADSEKRTQEALDKANADAQRLIDEAKESAASLSEKKAQEAVASAQQILAKAEEAAKAERLAMTTELKKEFGRLVTTTTANVTGKVLTDEDQKRINEEKRVDEAAGDRGNGEHPARIIAVRPAEDREGEGARDEPRLDGTRERRLAPGDQIDLPRQVDQDGGRDEPQRHREDLREEQDGDGAPFRASAFVTDCRRMRLAIGRGARDAGFVHGSCRLGFQAAPAGGFLKRRGRRTPGTAVIVA